MVNRIILLACFLLSLGDVWAQKLPGVQQSGLRVPADVKVDGKLLEWGNQLQAYNKSTDIFYSIANDDAMLYLVVEVKNPNIITKIIRGGLSFTINTSGKKSDKGAVSISYPIIEEKYSVNLSSRKLPEKTDDTVQNKRRADSAVYVYNRKLNSDTKIIGIEGIKDITDSTISVYNEQGIKARSLFDRQLNFIYELALPLKLLGITTTDRAVFSYHITLNGITPKNSTVQVSGKGLYLIVTSPNGVVSGIPNRPQNAVLAYPTDFWGEYTLAK